MVEGCRADTVPFAVASTLAHCRSCVVRSTSFCEALPEGAFAELAAILTRHRVAPGNVLVEEGTQAADLFNITDGLVRVYKLLADGRQQITGFLSAGDFLGLTPGAQYVYSASALTPVAFCRFPKRKLDPLLVRFPQLEHRLLKIASNELAAAEDQMLLLGRKTAIEKLASFLLMRRRKGDCRRHCATELLLPMTRTDIADYLGLTVFTVSRTLRQLRELGTIEIPSAERIRLLDSGALDRIAKGQLAAA